MRTCCVNGHVIRISPTGKSKPLHTGEMLLSLSTHSQGSSPCVLGQALTPLDVAQREIRIISETAFELGYFRRQGAKGTGDHLEADVGTQSRYSKVVTNDSVIRLDKNPVNIAGDISLQAPQSPDPMPGRPQSDHASLVSSNRVPRKIGGSDISQTSRPIQLG